MDYVKDFIAKEGSDLHPALQVASHFDSQRVEYTRREPYHDLEDALEQYQLTAKQPLEFDVKRCTWDDVLDERARALEEYNANGRGGKNIVRRIMRKAGDLTPAISPWLDLLPDEKGMSVLHGGLTLIFNAVRQRAENRTKIMEAFEDIPDIIEMARNKRRIFQSNQTLKDRTINLYTTLLHAITNLIASLLEKGYGNRIIAAFKGPLAGKPIDEILERVKRSAKALQSCVENIRDEKLTDIHKATAQTNVGMQAVRLNTKNTEIGVRGISTELVKVGGTMQSMSGQLKSLEDQMQEIHQMQEQMLMREKAEANGIDAQNGLFRFLCERVRVLESEKKELEIERSRTPIPYPASFLPLDQLLSALEVPYMEASNDLDYMLRQGKNFDIVAQGQARWLLQIKQFQGWLLSKDSDLLLVDGNADFDSSGPGRISPMSFLCATLVLSLLNNRPRPVSLHFFCGLHVASDDSLRGPNGLVRSLITQLLLTQREFSLNFINSHAYRKDLESQTLVALCHTFQQLVKQLPLDTLVLCVIDGISLYERAEWQGDLAFVVDRLNEIVKDECLQPTFKLLMASPYTSRYTQRQVAPCQHVVLQAGNANGLSISQRSLGMSVSQPQTLSGNPIRRPVPPRVELNDGEDDESSDEEYNLRFGV